MTIVMSLCYHFAMKVTLSLRIEDSTKEKLEALAKKMNRSVNNLLNVIIEEHLGWYEYHPNQQYKIQGVKGDFPSPLMDDEVWKKFLEQRGMANRKEKEDGR